MQPINQTRKPVLLSVVSIAVCIAVLVGATFAWFTDTETNKGNRIEAGTLDITAEWYNLASSSTNADAGGYDVNGTYYTFSESANDFATTTSSMITDENWQPGSVNAKLVKVTNSGSLGVMVSLNAVATDLGLEDALWFDFIAVSNGQTVGNFTVRAMYDLADFVSAQSMPLASESSIEFILVYGMLESAGDTYQDADYTADIIVTATQTNTTANTVVYAYSADDINAATANQTVVLMKNITAETAKIDLSHNVNFDLNGYTLTVASFTMASDDYCTVDIANGEIKAVNGDVSVQIPLGTVTIDGTIVAIGEDDQVIINASQHTLNLTGATQFLTLNSNNEITAVKAAVTIMDDTRVVVDTDATVTLKAESGASNVVVEDNVTGEQTVLPEEETTVAKTVVVSTLDALVEALMASQKVILNNDIDIAYGWQTDTLYESSTAMYKDTTCGDLFVKAIYHYGANIDLNGYTLSYSSSIFGVTTGVYYYAGINVTDKPVVIANGTLHIKQGSGVDSASGSISLSEDALLTLENVTYTTNGCAVYVGGPNATVNVIDTSITAPWYCLATNASASNGVVISQGLVMNYKGSTFATTGQGGIPVMTNVPSVLTMEDCTIYSAFVGLMVRGGVATVSDTTIYCTYEQIIDTNYLSSTWGSGTAVPFAGIVLGNRNTGSYMYDTVCSLDNVTIYTEGVYDDYSIYAWGHNSGNYDLTFDYTDCTFDGNIYVGGYNVTINGETVADMEADATEAVVYTVTAD